MNDYFNDERIVLTLDAGGTNFVFSAMQGCREIIEPITLPAVSEDLDEALTTIADGFRAVMERLDERPVAISFAFPGPADYRSGVIGDLPNFPAFKGGVALGPYLARQFGMPVFINNDGNLFAYGEAMSGALPRINSMLAEAGSRRQYRNLIGVTLGTGFGAGVVIDGTLLRGDNDCGGDIWCFRNKFTDHLIVEEDVSIRGVTRHYATLSGDTAPLTPKEIFEIAEGARPGNIQAAQKAFALLGEAAGDALAMMLTVIDGVVVIGGGLTGASRYIMPALMKELRSPLGSVAGQQWPRLQMEVYDLTDDSDFDRFATEELSYTFIPGTTEQVVYDNSKRTGILLSQNTSQAIARGAYIYALRHL